MAGKTYNFLGCKPAMMGRVA